MQLTTNQLESFKSLYKKHFGIDLNTQEALDKWLKLVNLMKIILSTNTNEVWKR